LIKVAHYIAKFLLAAGVKDIFTLTGGGAMHLNDAFGHSDLTCTYFHHEQACAIAADGYARIHNRIAPVCVTTGPGGTNAITGVVGAHLDSVPMLVISGQVRYDTTAHSTGLPLRAMGDQEFDIIRAVAPMTKYCEMITDPKRIRYCLEKALYLAQSGRPGACWLDIPLNVQGAFVEEESLQGYVRTGDEVPPAVSDALIDDVIARLRRAKRPVLYPGNGVRLAGAYNALMQVLEKLNIPVVETWNGIDLMPSAHPRYVGRAGSFGDRAGNFAVQNADLVLAIGNRLSVRQTGYNFKSWARAAEVICVEADAPEMQKPTAHIELPIHADALDFLSKLNEKLPNGPLFTEQSWLAQCLAWRQKYPVVQEKHYQDQQANAYCLIHELSRRLPENSLTVVGNGTACVAGSAAYVIQPGSRFIINSAIASMGYDLPAAIGACLGEGRRNTLCITGDGSIQMNLQELQTIIHHRLPIKLFVINNEGYHSIRQTQKNLFGGALVGVGVDSADLSFPSFEKLAWAYGFPYFCIRANDQWQVLDAVLAMPGPVMCEVFVSKDQVFEPKSATRKLEDGTLVSAPLEDLAPFLPREELKANMLIPLYTEE